MNIAVYDIDNTIFRSPEKPIGHKGGWWGKLLSLEPPFVPINPSTNWYNNVVISLLEKDYADPSTEVLVMTGRLDRFQPRLKEIFAAHGSPALSQIANNGEIITNPGTNDTFAYKVDRIIELIDLSISAGHTIDKITLYDDREPHVLNFSAVFEDLMYDDKIKSYATYLVVSTTPSGPAETIKMIAQSD